MKKFFIEKRVFIFALVAIVVAASGVSLAEARSKKISQRRGVVRYQYLRNKKVQSYSRRSIANKPVAAASQPVSAASQPVVNNEPVAPKTEASTPVSGGCSIEGVVSGLNAARASNGLAAVTVNSALNQAALAKAEHMADNNYFAHTAPDGTTDWSFLAAVGYNYAAAGSNLAMGSFGSSQELVDGWMNSTSHRENMLASFGQEVGIGMAGQYYVMFITKPM